MNDVADVLEQATVGVSHTPALYSCFLRALVSAKTETPTSDGDGQMSQTPHGHATPQGANGTASGSGTASAAAMNPLAEFQFDSEMGPVADISTFPPTMAPNPTEDNLGMLTMDSILSASFWDSVLVPGKPAMPIASSDRRADARVPAGYSNTMEGLSGGFVYGAGGSGLITPRFGLSPLHSGFNTPAHAKMPTDLTQHKIDVAFDASSSHS